MSLLHEALCFWNKPVRKTSRKPKPNRRPIRPVLSGEALEPRAMFAVDTNDQISEAINLGAMTANRSRTGQILDVADDVDMFKFTVTAGQRIGIDIDRPSGTLNSFLRLFNSAGTQLASNDNGPAPGEASSTESYLEFTFTTGGTYYFGVSGFGNQNYSATAGTGDTAGSTGRYNIALTRVAVVTPPASPSSSPSPAPAPTDTDPDDQINQAISLGAMTQSRSRTGESINVATDVDMFSFTVTAGQRIAFDVDRPSGSLDSYVRLFNSAGQQLAANDDGPTPGESSSTESYLEFTFTTGGTYFVGVSGFGNQNYSATTGTGDTNGRTGVYSLNLNVVQVAPPPPPTNSGFQISLTFNGLTASQQNVFNQAAARWSQIIVGDLPDVLFNGQVIDDVRISASATPIDGVGRILGQAGPTNLRSGSFLPFLGTMQFDTADMANMEANGTLFEVIIHEMGHVLGVGTIWSHLGLLTGAGGTNPRFTGSQATAAYNQMFGRNETGVPVENVAGPGSRDSHWRESVFGNELMTPFISNAGNPISRVTVASMADLGYTVNMNAAAAFNPPGSILSGSSSSGPATGAGLQSADHAEVAGDHDHGDHDHNEHDHEHLALPPAVVSGVVLPALNRRQADALARLAEANPRAVESFAAHLNGVDCLMDLLGRNLPNSLR